MLETINQIYCSTFHCPSWPMLQAQKFCQMTRGDANCQYAAQIIFESMESIANTLLSYEPKARVFYPLTGVCALLFAANQTEMIFSLSTLFGAIGGLAAIFHIDTVSGKNLIGDSPILAGSIIALGVITALIPIDTEDLDDFIVPRNLQLSTAPPA